MGAGVAVAGIVVGVAAMAVALGVCTVVVSCPSGSIPGAAGVTGVGTKADGVKVGVGGKFWPVWLLGDGE